MQRLSRVLMVLVPAALIAGAAAGEDKPAAKAAAKPAERSIIVPTDHVKFKVEGKQVVRLTGRGIAGATITAKVTGPAKVTAEGTVVEFKNGHPQIGPGVREFEVTPTGKGAVKVVISVKNPTGSNPPDETYEFDAE